MRASAVAPELATGCDAEDVVWRLDLILGQVEFRMKGIWGFSAPFSREASILLLDELTKLLKSIDRVSLLKERLFHLFDVYAFDQVLLDLGDWTYQKHSFP